MRWSLKAALAARSGRHPWQFKLQSPILTGRVTPCYAEQASPVPSRQPRSPHRTEELASFPPAP
jgi:hypothetical protein